MGIRISPARALGALAVGAVLTYGGLAAVAGHHGLSVIEDDQVGLLVDHLSGSTQVVDAPGYRLTWPLLQELHVWSKSPREHRMQGNRYESPGHVPRLIVRGHDGSSFWFERIALHYAVDSTGLETLLADVGTEPERTARIVDVFARAVLRRCLGAYSAQEIASIESLRAATDAAEDQLRRLLEGCGLQLLQVTTGKPRFVEAYEQTIHRRKVAEQETESLLQEIERLSAGHPERLEQIRRRKRLERFQTEVELTGRLEQARRETRRADHESQMALDSRLREGVRERDTKLSEAKWRLERWRDEASALAERSRFLAKRGRPMVRRALARTLARSAITLSSPQRHSEETGP